MKRAVAERERDQCRESGELVHWCNAANVRQNDQMERRRTHREKRGNCTKEFVQFSVTTQGEALQKGRTGKQNQIK